MTPSSSLPQPKTTRSARSEEVPGAGAVHQHGQWLEQAVSLDLLARIDPFQDGRDNRISTQTHREILAVCRRLRAEPPSTPSSKRALHQDMQSFRRELVLAINRVSARIPKRALSALRTAQQANVRYEVEGPFGPDGESATTDFAYSDVVFGKPDRALEAMVMLRAHTLQAQCHAMQLLSAMGGQRQSAYSMFNDTVPKRIRQGWVRQAGAQLLKLTSSTDAALQPLVDGVWHGLQCDSGMAPLAVALPGDASNDVLLQAADGYRALRWCLRSDLVQRPVGDDLECRRARRAWSTCGDCAMACQVVASWLSALSAAGPASRCEFCYRHRVTRRRCREHTVPESLTPEARLGRVLAEPFVLRVKTLSAIPEIRIVLAAELAPRALDFGPMLDQARLAQVPAHLQRQTAVLATQLRTLWPVLGDRLAREVGTLFAAMVDSVKACHSETRALSLEQDAHFKAQRKRSADLLTLSGFLRLWWGSGEPFDPIKLAGRGHDPAHPQLRSNIIGSSIAQAFLQQRAWCEAADEHRAVTTIDPARVIALQAEGRSLRQMAVVLGCSHEKVRRLLMATGHEPRKRTVLRPYRGADFELVPQVLIEFKG